MPSKKKKYNARFPAGRIKKIMQTDEEVGKVAQAVPVIISRTLELFVGSLLTKAMQITSAKNAKTLSPSHMKQCILSEQRFDFLKDLVKTVQDSTNGEEETNTATNLLPPGPNMSVSERRKSSCTVLKEEVRNDEELIQEEIKEETKQEIKEEPEWSERVPQQPASANCSTLRLCPNFYTETWPEQRVSIHKPPVVPGYQPAHPSYSPAKPTYQPAQPSYQPAQPLYQVAQPSYPESSSLTPSPILVMDEDYDT